MIRDEVGNDCLFPLPITGTLSPDPDQLRVWYVYTDTKHPATAHPHMRSRTFERFSGVRLGSGEEDKHTIIITINNTYMKEGFIHGIYMYSHWSKD